MRGDVDQNRTTIRPNGAPQWSTPVWARFYNLSPEAGSVLVLTPGGNLNGTRAPDQVVLTVWYPKGGSVRSRPFTLAEVMNPADMPQTVSHYLRLERYAPGEKGWRTPLADGRTITKTYR